VLSSYFFVVSEGGCAIRGTPAQQLARRCLAGILVITRLRLVFTGIRKPGA
jgi:hypothetical protein